MIDQIHHLKYQVPNPKYRTEDLREWGDLIRSCVVKKKDEFGQVGTETSASSKWVSGTIQRVSE